MSKRRMSRFSGVREEHADDAIRFAESAVINIGAAENNMAEGQCVSALINMEDAFGSYGEMTASLEGAGVDEESWAPEYMEVFGKLNSAHVDFEQKCLVPGERMLSGLRRRRR